ncbi:MAG: restriction endonuclease subunit S [Acidimicrobiia bacterium]|nr:restriction endonuclease subunit S [Acidimicrobiia bacterium]MYE62780.1 restriction endonuclease subunit S [Rhodothermaceae bacterium]MYJ20535.1 restriction endonuclease subunit S [Rhodothermaceae bacterium]
MTWPTRPLADVADFCLGKMLDQRKNKGTLLPYLANVNVRWGQFDLDDLREMRFEAAEMERYGVKYGDIVMCEGGEPGRCAIWKDQMPGMMIQKALHRIRPHECLDHRFLFYSFLHTGKKGGFSPLFTGATIKHLPRQKLAKVEVPVPRLEIQLKIADILSAYDDLIENNRRRIALLERAAREIYREWFVRLRFPGHEHSKIVDNVPEGWERTALRNICQLKYGKALKAEHRVRGEYPVYGSSGIIGTHDKARVQGPGIIIGRKGNVGSVYWSDGDFCPIDTVYFLEPSAVTLYFYYVLQNVDFINTDVAVPGLNRNFAYSREILVPSDQVRDAFDDIAKPLHDQISLLRKENKSLSLARDLLLPRLMDGRISV